MKLHIYTNNGFDTVALVDGETVISQWPETAIEEALKATDPRDWDNQGLEVDLNDFEKGNELFAVVSEIGEIDTPDDDLFSSRIAFHFGENSEFKARK